jgi:site-specific recombinase XerD
MTKHKKASQRSLKEAGKKWRDISDKKSHSENTRRELIYSLVKPNTLRTYRSIWNNLKEFLDHAGEAAMTEDTFTHVIQHYKDEGYSSSHITTVKAALMFAQKCGLEWAGEKGWLNSQEMQDVCRGAAAASSSKTKKTGTIQHDKLIEIGDKCENISLRRALLMAWDAGLRVSELLDLTTDSMNGSSIIIKNNKATKATSKKTTAMEITISDTFKNCFTAQVKSQKKRKVEHKSLWKDSGVHRQSIAEIIKRTATENNWSSDLKWCAHSLRHGAANRIANYPNSEARESLRMHKTTFAHYAKSNEVKSV